MKKSQPIEGSADAYGKGNSMETVWGAVSEPVTFQASRLSESGRVDSNHRPLDPQSSALTRLRYAPKEERIHCQS